MDSFGVGTRLNVSADAPSLDLVYKLVRCGDQRRAEAGEGRETWVGAKALFRSYGADGLIGGDVLSLKEETPPSGSVSLIQVVMDEGELLRPHPSLADIRRHCAGQLATLSHELKRLDGHGQYPVAVSPGLRAGQERALVEVGAPRRN